MSDRRYEFQWQIKGKDVRTFFLTRFLIFVGSSILHTVAGADRCASRLNQILKREITREDMEVYAALKAQELENQGGGGDEEEEEEELQWSWDPEYASDDIRTLQYGTVVAMIKTEDDDSEAIESVKWQIETSGGSNDGFEDLSPDVCVQLEKAYRSGRFFLEGVMTAMGETESASVSLDTQKCVIESDFVKGLYCELASLPYETFQCRRKGQRHPVKGDEKFTTENQKLADKWMAEQAERETAWKARRAEANKGKDIQGIRGTNALSEDTGVYKWTMIWGHEPGRSGGGDAVGLGKCYSILWLTVIHSSYCRQVEQYRL